MIVYGIIYWNKEYMTYMYYGGIDIKLYSNKQDAQKEADTLNKLFHLDGILSYSVEEINVKVHAPY